MRKFFGFLGLSFIADAWSCGDGTVPGEYQLQLTLAVDMAAFAGNDVWKTYRSELSGLVHELSTMYGEDTIVSLYGFTNKGAHGWCASCYDVRELPAATAAKKLDAFWLKYPNLIIRPLSDSGNPSKKYSSLGDVIFHILGNGNWNSTVAQGVQTVRVVNTATDTNPWVEHHGDYEDKRLQTLQDVQSHKDPWDYCYGTAYVQKSQTAALTSHMTVPINFHFLSQRGEMTDDVTAFLGGEYLPRNLAGANGWSDALPTGGLHKALSHQRIQESICAAFRDGEPGNCVKALMELVK